MTNSTTPADDKTAQGHAERRAEIVDAAIRAFAQKGYGGTTLADIADEAGVSQPRISQVFGNKENAFITAYRRAVAELFSVFEASVAASYSLPSLARGYLDVLRDRPEILLVSFQALTSSYVPSIAEECRRAMNRTAEIVLGAGGTPDDARVFLERGFFINAMVASGALQHSMDYPALRQAFETVDEA
ncbi:MAG: TetR/AcrR family transcriptional regulator [Propionibacteriaceae bacterium]|nr:TetR/AcrR family transcriptional regulator [Propionibacteriaceae bacterium]